MQYITLLRGINVGENRKVEMKKLKNIFEKLGYQNISTYINSGNVIFESAKDKKVLTQEIVWLSRDEARLLIVKSEIFDGISLTPLFSVL